MRNPIVNTQIVQDFEDFRQASGLVSRKAKRQQRDLEVCRDYEVLLAEGKPKLEILQYLMRKYDIGSQGTIYVIRQRVQKELSKSKH